MSEAIVAKRYAEALFQLGVEKNTLEPIVKELRIVEEVFQGNEQLDTFLQHPRVNNEKKQQLLQEAFQGFQADVVNTLKLLVERHRVGVTSLIIKHFFQLVNDANEIAEASVYSVRKLSDSEKEVLEHNFAKRFNKKAIKIENIVDASIIGGLRVRIGNTILDGSVSAKLKRIERSIVTANK